MAQEQGKQFASLVDAPSLTLYEDFYFQAFQELNGSRLSNGFGVSPIMLSELMAYADLYAIRPGEERMEFVRFMRVMDGAYLKQMNTKEAVSNG